MRLPGYKRSEPDPIRPGVMAPGRAPSAILTLPRPRISILCALRGHKRIQHQLSNRGEQWSVFVFMCQRCHKLLDAKAGTRVTT